MSDGICITDHRFGVPPINGYEPPLLEGERRCLEQIRDRIERAVHSASSPETIQIDRVDALILARALRRAEQ